MRKTFVIIFSVAICFMVGFAASWFQMEALQEWYPLLKKPALTPPNMVFPIAWGILYVLMGVSIGLIVIARSAQTRFLVALFGVQLFFNFTWSIAFFYLQNPLLGMVNIIVLDILVIYYAVMSYPVKKASSFLFIPYIAWLLFATYLNAYILMNN